MQAGPGPDVGLFKRASRSYPNKWIGSSKTGMLSRARDVCLTTALQGQS